MPKRARTPQPSSSSSSGSESTGGGINTLDATKFVNLSAQHYYWEVLSVKSFIPERGLKPKAQDGRILDQIRRLGWLLFIKTPKSAPMAIVREFYANARETQNGISFVRGKQISYSAQAINELFRLPSATAEATNWVVHERYETDLDTLIQEMCQPGTQWRTQPGTTLKVHFPQTALNRYAKAWYAFICASILPTTHHQDVTRDRAVLLHRILRGGSIDVGYIINQSMLRFMRAVTSGAIPHSSIITRLCLAANVEWGEETLQLPMRDIDSATIRKYNVWRGGESRPNGLGFIMADEEEEASEEDVPAPPVQQRGASGHARDMRRLQRRMDALHTSFRDYSVSFAGALSEAFSQQGVHVEFPTFGSGIPYPPPDTPPGGAEDAS